MVKPDFDLWTRTDPIFRVVNRFCILCLIGSRVKSGNDRVGSGFFLLLTPTPLTPQESALAEDFKLQLYCEIKKLICLISKLPFWSLWFGYFCYFSPNLKLFKSGSLWFTFIAILIQNSKTFFLLLEPAYFFFFFTSSIDSKHSLLTSKNSTAGYGTILTTTTTTYLPSQSSPKIVIARARYHTKKFITRRRPWCEFFDYTIITRPLSYEDINRRIKQNLNYFQVNYAMGILLILFLSLIYKPISMITFLICGCFQICGLRFFLGKMMVKWGKMMVK
ncbi:putative prenylated rab acceptor P [Helianthus anomalus]